MKRSEWIEVVQRLRLNWPHSPIPDNSIAKWYEDLKHIPVEQVVAAVEVMYRDGREYGPNGGQILAKLAELERDDPDYSEAWEIAHKLIGRVSPLHEPDQFLTALAERSPAAAEAVRRLSPRSFGSYDLEDEATVRAQFRGFYEAVVRERQRDRAYAGIPESGLRGLAPRRIGDVLAELEVAP